MNSEDNIITLNNRDFEFHCSLTSTAEGETEPSFLPIAFNNIEDIVIDDSMFDPFLDVYVQFSSGVILDNVDVFKYNIKANNNNTCYLSIKPVGSETQTQENEDITSLVFTGVIDNIKSFDSENKLQTSSTLIKLIDEKEATLKEKKICKFLPTVDSSIPIGNNIKNILTKGITDCKFGEFEEGTLSVKTNYLYPVYFNFFDAIKFLMPFNVTEKETLPSQTFLKYNTETNKFENKAILDLFLNYDEVDNNLESFSLGLQDGPLNELTEGDRPVGPVSEFLPLENGIESASITNIGFNTSNELFVPYMVSNTTDFTNTNQFQFVDLKPELENFDKNIIKKMKSFYSDTIRANVDLDQSKIDKKNYRVITSPFPNSVNVKVAKSQMYSSFIFHNMSMTITTNGQFYRSPGKFINIVRPPDQKGKDNAYEKKVYGQWLVTDVRHIIRSNGFYKNVIQCVKPFINY